MHTARGHRRRRYDRYHGRDEVEPMTAQNPPTTTAPAALSAFLKGVERRAALFADLQGGDPSATEAALASTLGGFVATAARHPVADWPRRFWSMLLAAPTLRAPSVAAHWPTAFDRLAQVGRGPRAALLLSLVARLQEDDAAAVLGVAQPTYRLALRRALPVDAEGNPDAATWHGLDRAIRLALADVPAARLDRLVRLREAALAGRELASEPATWQPRQVLGKRPPDAAQRRWVLPVLWAAVGACVIAFVVSFLLPGLLPGPAGNDVTADMPVQESTLVDTDPPASRFDDDVALLSHGDFDQLADTRDAELIDTFDVYAWYAAQLQSGAAKALPLPDAAEPLPDPSEVETMGEDAHAPR